MKAAKIQLLCIILLYLLIFTSCSSASPSLSQQPQTGENSSSFFQESSEQASSENTRDTAETMQKDEDLKQQSIQAYEELTSSLVMKPLVLPPPSVKGTSFKKPFSIQVSYTNSLPASQVPVTVEYPGSISYGIVQFSKMEMLTNDQGILEFISPPANFSCNSVISFYPSPSEQYPELSSIANRISLKIPYLVKTNLTASGGSICIVDYDKEGNPILSNGLSSSAVLGSLIRNGFTRIGNAEFYKEVASGNLDVLLKSAKDLFGSITSYFIIGTVKYAEPPFENEDKTVTVKLIAEISCIDMKTDAILFSTSVEAAGSGKNEQSALTSVRTEQLAPLLAEKIMYGM